MELFKRIESGTTSEKDVELVNRHIKFNWILLISVGLGLLLIGIVCGFFTGLGV